MLKIVICDDEVIFTETMKEALAREFGLHGLQCEYSCYTDGKNLLQKVGQTEPEDFPDLIFLDISMPGTTGMDVAKKLREKKQNQKIVFVTAYDHLVFEALHYYPLQFLRKSCLKEDLPGIIQEYINRREEKKIFFRYKRGTEYRNLDTEEMIYLSHFQHAITIHLNGKEKERFRGSIQECVKQLQIPGFIKINQGCIANIRYCRRINARNSTITMENGAILSVSRECMEKTKREYMRRWK